MHKKYFSRIVFVMMLFMLVSLIMNAQSQEEKEKINNYLEQYSKWEVKTTIIKDDRPLFRVGGCLPVEKSMEPQNLSQILIMSDTLRVLPGDFIQGREFREGKLTSIPIARKSVKLSSDLKMGNPGRIIDNPTIDKVNRAIQGLRNEADSSIGEIKAIPGNMQFAVAETYTYDQTLLSMSVPLEFSGSLEYLRYRFSSYEMDFYPTTTVICKIAQPMYTIFMAKDQYSTPADMFEDKVVLSDLQEQEKLGRIGTDNPLLFIESVTYGRMLIFTITCPRYKDLNLKEKVINGFESYKAGKEISPEYKSVLGSARVSLVNFGGEESKGEEAVKSGNFGDFFTNVGATDAVPLYFVANDLKKNIASLGYNVTYKRMECGMKIPVRVTEKIRLQFMNGRYFSKAVSEMSGPATLQYYAKMNSYPVTLHLLGNAGDIASGVTVFQIQNPDDIMRNHYIDPNYNIIGAWDMTSYPYYYKDGYGDHQLWRMFKVGGNTGDIIHYGDEVIIKNAKYWSYSLCEHNDYVYLKEDDGCKWKVTWGGH